jgi:hypothetical protein
MFFRLVIPALAARKAAEVIACFSEFDGVAHYSFVRYFIDGLKFSHGGFPTSGSC